MTIPEDEKHHSYLNESLNQRIDNVYGGTVVNKVVINHGLIVYGDQTTWKEPKLPPSSSGQLGPNPYQGLQAFGESDYWRFFGRKDETDDLLERLRSLHRIPNAVRILPVLGASGSGKSSLVRAGVIPYLSVKDVLPGFDKARVGVLVPGTHPLESLATVLARIVTDDPAPLAKTREFAEELLRTDHAGNYNGLRRIADVFPKIANSPLVVVVDQFEEIYSLCQSLEERNAFIGNLFTAAKEASQRVLVILNLRSDFLEATQQHPELNQLISKQGYIVPAMTERSLRDAISKPAEKAKHPLSRAVVNLLLEQCKAQNGSLPLLQFALTRIWEGMRRGVEPAITLEKIGGVGGALAKEAQSIYEELNGQEEQEIARRVFSGLVQLGEGARDTRRRETITSLTGHQDDPQKVKQVIDRFAYRGVRLLTVSTDNSGNETVEVTHEALFEHWALLKEWLNSNRDDIRFHQRLKEAAQLWEQRGKPEGSLWRPPDLDDLKEYHQKSHNNMTSLMVEFFDASLRTFNNSLSQRKKQRKRLLSTLSIGLVVSFSASIIASLNIRQAQKETISRNLAEAAEKIDTDPYESLKHAIVAVGTGKSPIVRFPNLGLENFISESILLEYIKAVPEVVKWQAHSDLATEVAFSPDGKIIASSGVDNSIKLWDEEGNLLKEIVEGHNDRVITSVIFHPEGNSIATSSYDGTIRLWNLEGQLVAKPFRGHGGWVHSIAFSPSGEYLVSAGENGDIRLWNLNGQQIAPTFQGHVGRVFSIEFSPNEEMIVSSGIDGTIRLWSLEGEPLADPFTGHEGAVSSVEFSSDNQLIVSGGQDGTIRIWDLEGNLFNEPFYGHNDWVESVAFSPDNEIIASGSRDGTVRLWSLEGELIQVPFEGHSEGGIELYLGSETGFRSPLRENNSVYSVDFGHDGKFLVSSGADGQIHKWTVKSEPFGEVFQVTRNLGESIALSSDSQMVASLNLGEGLIRLSDLKGRVFGHLLPQESDNLTSISFGSNPEMIVGGSSDGNIYIWNIERDSADVFFSGHEDRINTLAVSYVSNLIASGSDDGTVRLWDFDGNPIEKPFTGHEDKVNSVAFSPVVDLIVSGSDDGTIRLWDFDGNPIGKPFTGHEDKVNSVTFSPVADLIVSGSDDGTVRLWDFDGNPIGKPFTGHADAVTWIKGNRSDGQRMGFGGDPIGDGHPFRSGRVHSVVFSDDGQFIASGGLDGNVRLWYHWPWQGWLYEACQRAAFVNNGMNDGVDDGERTQLAQRICYKSGHLINKQ